MPASYKTPTPMVSGLRCCCPRCGEGKLFSGFLKLAPACDVCGLDYGFADPADGPAFVLGQDALLGGPDGGVRLRLEEELAVIGQMGFAPYFLTVARVVDDVRAHFPEKVLNTVIPRSVRISEAPSYGQSVISYDAASPGSLSYLEAAAEIARRGAPQ